MVFIDNVTLVTSLVYKGLQVGYHMALQVVFQGEMSAAHITAESLVARVNLHVPHEMGVGPEQLATMWAWVVSRAAGDGLHKICNRK